MKNFFIKNGIFRAQEMTALVKCMTCILQGLCDLQNSHFKSWAWQHVLGIPGWGGGNRGFLGLPSQSNILGKFQASKRSILKNWETAPKVVLWILMSIHTHACAPTHRHVHPCTHTQAHTSSILLLNSTLSSFAPEAWLARVEVNVQRQSEEDLDPSSDR